MMLKVSPKYSIKQPHSCNFKVTVSKCSGITGEIVKGERVKIKGYLEDFALSKNEADELIMSARKKIYNN